MSEGELRKDFDPFNFSIPLGFLDQKTKPFYNQDEQEGGQRAALPNSMRGSKKGGSRSIYKDSKVGWRDATQDPINPNKGNTDLNKDETDKGPINSVKSFW